MLLDALRTVPWAAPGVRPAPRPPVSPLPGAVLIDADGLAGRRRHRPPLVPDGHRRPRVHLAVARLPQAVRPVLDRHRRVAAGDAHRQAPGRTHVPDADQRVPVEFSATRARTSWNGPRTPEAERLDDRRARAAPVVLGRHRLPPAGPQRLKVPTLPARRISPGPGAHGLHRRRRVLRLPVDIENSTARRAPRFPSRSTATASRSAAAPGAPDEQLVHYQGTSPWPGGGSPVHQGPATRPGVFPGHPQGRPAVAHPPRGQHAGRAAPWNCWSFGA